MFFFHDFWEVVKDDIMDLVTQVRKGCARIDKINYSQTMLIPIGKIFEKRKENEEFIIQTKTANMWIIYYRDLHLEPRKTKMRVS